MLDICHIQAGGDNFYRNAIVNRKQETTAKTVVRPNTELVSSNIVSDLIGN